MTRAQTLPEPVMNKLLAMSPADAAVALLADTRNDVRAAEVTLWETWKLIAGPMENGARPDQDTPAAKGTAAIIRALVDEVAKRRHGIAA